LILNRCEILKPPPSTLIPIHQKIRDRWVFRHGNGTPDLALREEVEVMERRLEIYTVEAVIEVAFGLFTSAMRLLLKV
jgi:hypothetical protein